MRRRRQLLITGLALMLAGAVGCWAFEIRTGRWVTAVVFLGVGVFIFTSVAVVARRKQAEQE